jgi:hypothetical protein
VSFKCKACCVQFTSSVVLSPSGYSVNLCLLVYILRLPQIELDTYDCFDDSRKTSVCLRCLSHREHVMDSVFPVFALCHKYQAETAGRRISQPLVCSVSHYYIYSLEIFPLACIVMRNLFRVCVTRWNEAIAAGQAERRVASELSLHPVEHNSKLGKISVICFTAPEILTWRKRAVT